MNIEKSIECLKLKIKKDNSIIQGMFGDIYDEIRKDNKAIETLITVYDKQQKEIEDLKTLTREYEAYELGEGNKIIIASKEWFADGYFKDFLGNYISKDKIKGKIEELKNRKIGASTGIFAVQVDILEELLQDGQESDQEGGQEDE